MENTDTSTESLIHSEEQDQEFKIDIGTILFLIIGGIISWLNMALILIYQEGDFASIVKIMAFLSIIFITIIPAVIIGLKNRFWAYGYLIGFSVAGVPFMIFVDLFIGGYTFTTSLFIFIIMWLIFWKTWRSLSKIAKVEQRRT